MAKLIVNNKFELNGKITVRRTLENENLIIVGSLATHYYLEEIIEKAVKKFERKGSKEIVEYMHKEEAYLRTNENEVIPFSKDYKLRPF